MRTRRPLLATALALSAAAAAFAGAAFASHQEGGDGAPGDFGLTRSTGSPGATGHRGEGLGGELAPKPRFRFFPVRRDERTIHPPTDEFAPDHGGAHRFHVAGVGLCPYESHQGRLVALHCHAPEL